MTTTSGDILLVEDLAATIEGLALDLKSRGGAVFVVPNAEDAHKSIRQDRWDLILFDLRIPSSQGGDPRLDVGVNLIRSNIDGKLGELNRTTLFGIITMQTAVAEAEQFIDHPSFLGFFSKSEDSRRLFRILRDRGILKSHELDDTDAPEVRRRTKFLVRAIDRRKDVAYLVAITWGDEEFEVELSSFRPGIRREIIEAKLPIFVYGTANVAATEAYMLEPHDFEEVVDMVEPLKLDVSPDDQ
jgi:CheY-like chemotaxis protein